MTGVTLPGTGTKIETVAGEDGAERQVIHVANLPVSQPVTAEALPLPLGAATEATAAALLVAASAIKAAAETLAGRTINTSAVSGTVALDGATLAALENITATLAGPVAVSNFPAATGLTDAELRASPVSITSASAYAEDSPHVSGAIGNLMLAIRSDDDLPTANNNDYTILKMDEEGRLKVASKPASYAPTVGNITSATSTVFVNTERFSNLMIHCKGTFAGVNCIFEGSLDSTNGTDGTWFGTQAARSNVNTPDTATGVLGAAPAYAWELSVNAMKWFRVRATAWTSGTQTWTMVPGTYATEPIPIAQVTATQPVSVSGYPTAAASADGLANPTITQVGAAQLAYNGATWDRLRGNFNVNTGDTGAKTTTGNGATQTNFNARGATVAFNIGAVTGTSPTAVFKLQGSADGGTTWYDIPGAATASITASGVYVLQVYPGVAAVANAAVNGPLPRTWRAVWTLGGTTPSFTITNVQVAYHL
ncbi:MAG: hypothetical protein QE495_01355 [Acidovorax sp.]|uniref:hypothetical protein n=1 Tax=Acidovorax sp. TaxID=1872122 RepID=UPI0026064D47|nr:hypothetical protein [Acidovorax sp.]MDH4425074.1 hypothetical protein [Acidovorax sp.]